MFVLVWSADETLSDECTAKAYECYEDAFADMGRQWSAAVMDSGGTTEETLTFGERRACAYDASHMYIGMMRDYFAWIDDKRQDTWAILEMDDVKKDVED